MTNREAIEQLKTMSNFIGYDKGSLVVSNMQNALERGIECIEKQEPKKVLIWAVDNVNDSDSLGDCPNCRGTTTKNKSPKRCRFCGQALKWEVNNDN